jgi:hypothetical protein
MPQAIVFHLTLSRLDEHNQAMAAKAKNPAKEIKGRIIDNLALLTIYM